MIPRKNLLRLAAAVMLTASGACTWSSDVALAPNTTRALTIPAIGATADAVVAMNGEPERRERADGADVWVYNRLQPEGTGLRSRSALIRFRDGVVVGVEETLGGLFTPAPTVPAARVTRSAS